MKFGNVKFGKGMYGKTAECDVTLEDFDLTVRLTVRRNGRGLVCGGVHVIKEEEHNGVVMQVFSSSDFSFTYITQEVAKLTEKVLLSIIESLKTTHIATIEEHVRSHYKKES
jgi:hypothetical protein